MFAATFYYLFAQNQFVNSVDERLDFGAGVTDELKTKNISNFIKRFKFYSMLYLKLLY